MVLAFLGCSSLFVFFSVTQNRKLLLTIKNRNIIDQGESETHVFVGKICLSY